MQSASIVTQNGRRSLMLPDDFEADCSEYHIRQIGRIVVLVPSDCEMWQLMAESLEEFSDDFMAERNQPANQMREAPFD